MMQTLVLLWISIKIVSGLQNIVIDGGNFSSKCINERIELVVPYISNDQGQFLDNIPQDINDNIFVAEDTVFPDFVHVTVPFQAERVVLTLSKQHIHTSKRQKVWERDGVTYMRTFEDDCFYQGHANEEEDSFVAVSLCDGLRGYLQTEESQIIIQPAGGTNTHNMTRKHVIRKCEKPQEARLHLPPQSSRHKRQARGNKKFLEVLVAADSSVVNLVGKDNAETYLLSLMNIVNDIYKHGTLSVDIEVITVKVLQIDKRTEKTIIAKNDARNTVDRFCRWATIQAYNNQYYGGGHNFDVAVYLTRTGIGPAGYAPITGMCNPGRSCAVVKDEGFTSAFIIAHEIAHVFGLFHNGHGNRCSGQKYQTSIMAATVQATLQQYWWTECSNERMNQVLPILTCLNNDPAKALSADQGPIGQRFSLNQQCRFEFGERHTLCRNFYGDICSMLWCAEERRSNLCKTKRGPPLNGTKCGNERWCIGGSCVYYGNNKAVDGQWGQWTEWSNCSADCGIGLKQRTRSCDDPSPAYGGKNCDGVTSEMDTCKAPDCTTYTDSRKLQCTVLNSLPIRRGTHYWLPYEVNDVRKQCLLTCISNRTKEVATFDDIPVDNGTPCSYDEPNNICLDGKCIEVGCDGVRNSKLKEDRCGNCGGNGSECKVVSGLFNQKIPYTGKGMEYAEVIVLPKGSRYIEMKETATSPHILALYDPAYGRYLLNGNNVQERSRDFVAKGAWFVYKNIYGHETLTSKGPLQRMLVVLVNPRNKYSLTSISFNYTVPKDDFTYEKQLYEYKYDGWSDCSVTCGMGTQSLIYNCFNKQTGEKMDDETKCQYLEKPATPPVKCERIDCNADVFRWAMSLEWTDCNATCGDDGYQYQKYKCERDTSNGKSVDVSFDLCDFLPAPNYSRPCNRKQCKEYKWIATDEWSECSESCGQNGIKTKIYHCVDDSKTRLADDECSGSFKPETAVPCNRKTCIREWYRLETTDRWGECSTSCGWDGLQTRIYECKKINSNDEVEIVPVDRCESYQGDKEMRPCNRMACDNGLYDWIRLSDWSSCSASCGDVGTQYQEYGCFEISVETDIHPVNSSFCDDIGGPNVTRPCNRIPCLTHQWVPSGWGLCNSSCGNDGVQQQIYSCERHYSNGSFEAVEESFCSTITLNNSSRECNRDPCFTFTWVMSPNWTECTATCGDDGVQFQMYSCYIHFVNDTMISAKDNDDCKNLETPIISRECNRVPCVSYQWSEVFDWGACSQTCGDGGAQAKIRVCEQVYTDGSLLPVASSLCAHIANEAETRSCNRDPCPVKFTTRLRYTNLSECSTTCGSSGTQRYNVACQKLFEDGRTEMTDMSLCQGQSLPQQDIPCRRRSCPSQADWKVTDWSKCSVSCGMGIETRNVYCGDASGTVPNSLCSGDAPIQSQVCSQPACPRSTCTDRIGICRRSASRRKCSYSGYEKMCCASCQRYRT